MRNGQVDRSECTVTEELRLRRVQCRRIRLNGCDDLGLQKVLQLLKLSPCLLDAGMCIGIVLFKSNDLHTLGNDLIANLLYRRIVRDIIRLACRLLLAQLLISCIE